MFSLPRLRRRKRRKARKIHTSLLHIALLGGEPWIFAITQKSVRSCPFAITLLLHCKTTPYHFFSQYKTATLIRTKEILVSSVSNERICILLRATMCSQGLQRDSKSECEWKELNDFLRLSKKSGSAPSGRVLLSFSRNKKKVALRRGRNTPVLCVLQFPVRECNKISVDKAVKVAVHNSSYVA